MNFETILIQGSPPYLQWPGWAGLVFWVVSLALVLLLLVRQRRFQKQLLPVEWGLAVMLAAAGIGSALSFGFHIPLIEPLTTPGQLHRITQVVWPIFHVLPFMLAAGVLGPLPGTLIAALTGSTLGLFFTHNPFTTVEYAAVGLLLGMLLNQRYRTPVFRLLRVPPAAAVGAALLHPFLFTAGVLLWTDGPLIEELDYAFRQLPAVSTAFLASMAGASLVAWAVARVLPDRWGLRSPLEASPAERSIEIRSITLMGMFNAGLVLALSALGWLAAHSSAERLTEERMRGAAGLAAENVPGALEIGQNLIFAAAGTPGLESTVSDQAARILADALAGSPFFHQLLLVDAEGVVVNRAGGLQAPAGELTAAEFAGVGLAFAGVPFQYYGTVLSEAEPFAVVSFIAPTVDGGRVLVGRSVLSDNPFTAPLLTSLNALAEIGGTGSLVDESGLILYHPVAEMVGGQYPGTGLIETGFSTGTTPEGRRVLVYAAPAAGRSWQVVVEVPVQRVQQLAMEIAAPLIGLLLALAAVSLVLLRFTLQFVTGSLRSLSNDALRIAQDRGSLSTPLQAAGEDEVGTMRRAFESMRSSLKSRMDEQEQLLQASTGVAGSLDFATAVRPLLRAGLSMGAASARVVLTVGALPEYGAGETQTFGVGSTGNDFTYLDSQVLHLCRETSPLIVREPAADGRLRFTESRPVPGALLGIALRQESHYFGALWLAYSEGHSIEEDEVRFVATLAAQGALAAANSRLFRGAEAGRERLAAILASTPDPVIVTDQHHALLLANPAAWQSLGGGLAQGTGKPIETLILNEHLLALLKSGEPEAQTAEIELDGQRVYVAKATPVISGGKAIGRICVLRDVTRFKELDALKSEFVSTISHDLRSPLLLIRGYATMVSMVGELTDEQLQFVGKITLGVDRMTALVENLLHLGRLEAGVGMQLEPVDPAALIAEVVDHLRPLAERKRIALSIGDSQPAPEIQADPAFLERAVNNLVENAIKYTQEGGWVEVRAVADERGEEVRFEVADNGMGISLADQERLFERFFRASNRDARKQSGAGLGLAIVRSIAERHGGRVWVDSELGRGSVFTLALPQSHR